MRTVLVWFTVMVAVWAGLLAVLAVAILVPSARRDKAERDVWVQFEQATGRHE